MLKKLLFTAAALIVGGTLAAPKAEAALFTCFEGMTLQTFLSNPEGCRIGDKEYDIVSYTGNLAAADVNVNISNPLSGQFYNVQFDPSANLAWSALSLQWDVRVWTGTDRITVVQDQMFAVGTAPTSDAVLFCAEGVCQNAMNVIGQQTKVFNGISTQDLQNSAVYSPGASPTGLASVEQTLQQTSVPEPASLLLLGTGLLGWGVSLRRRVKR